MTRCHYDMIFRRVFCVTLIIIGIAFTVILANIFVDIDGLLAKKDKVKHLDDTEQIFDDENVPANAPLQYNQQDTLDEQNAYKYRSKRSLDPQDFLFHIRNPKVKSILTRRLATLLDELDEEESSIHDKSNNEVPATAKEIEDMNKNENPNDAHKYLNKRHDTSDTEDDLIHLAMHNILLQGIIGHMDLSEVYKKVHLLINNFKKTRDNSEENKRYSLKKQATPLKRILNEMLDRDDEDLKNKENYDDKNEIVDKMDLVDNKPKATCKPFAEKNKLVLEEMTDCDKLNMEMNKITKMQTSQKPDTKKVKLPKVLIRTIIDITSLNRNNSQKNGDNESKERVKGIIQLIYNGKAIPFSRMDDKGSDTTKQFTDTTDVSVTDVPINNYQNNHDDNALVNDAIEVLQDNNQHREKVNTYLNVLLGEYLRKNPEKINSFLTSIESRHKYKTRRQKRQIKIHYGDDKTKKTEANSKNISLAKTNDDELYVEIETHFDSKGMKGEKKKKLIRHLIDKIQKAIHSDSDLTNDNKKKNKHKRYQVKKRTQHPLDKNKARFINSLLFPISNDVEKHSSVISKTSALLRDQTIPIITDKFGNSWKTLNSGPAFLTVSKSVNSAELGELSIDYNKESPMSDISQRMQKPLNIDSSEETINSNTYFDMGGLKFFIKDLDGTGLSIGFNQYTDEPPDTKTMKLFTGFEQIITSHNQDNYEQLDLEDINSPDVYARNNIHDMNKRDITDQRNNQHIVVRRSIEELEKEDYHSNEYNINFYGNFLPYSNYEDVIQDNRKKIPIKINNDDNNKINLKENNANIEKYNYNINRIAVLMGDNISNEKLKSAKIFNLDKMLTRNKRGVPVKSITNIKSKMKLNKFIKRRGRFDPKKLILSKRRSKRQIDKIRIIDGNPVQNTHSAENVLLVADEDLFADRAIIREVVDTHDDIMGDIARKQDKNENFQERIPYWYQDSPVFRRFSGRYRTKGLMSRYPHIIMEEISKSNEQLVPQTVDRLDQKSLKTNHILRNVFDSTTEANSTSDMPNFEEIVGALESYEPIQNYKLTVKIMPKNNASTPDLAFKEMYTSINKSFNKNGKVFSSTYNISEVSKIEDLSSKASTNLIILTTAPTPLIPQSTAPVFKKQVENQQAELDLILRERQKKIDEQLEHLKKEKKKIETLAVKNNQFNPMETYQKILNKTLPKFDINHLISIMKQQTQDLVTPEPTTTTVAVAATSYLDLEKFKIIDTIRRNENLTNEILHQINKNTAILQVFLSKLSDRLPSSVFGRAKDNNLTEEGKMKKEESDKLWNPFNLRHPHVNLERLNNDSHAPIPFVYAFQHPYPAQHKSQKPAIASVVYYGHIHTSKLKEPNDYRRIDEDGKNQTKYFLDGVSNGFKEIIRKDLDVASKNSSNSIH